MSDDDILKRKKLTFYIGLQNEPLGDEPNVSISFDISLRVFCIAFALSEKEKGWKVWNDQEEDDQDDKDVKIDIKTDDEDEGVTNDDLEADNSDNNSDKRDDK